MADRRPLVRLGKIDELDPADRLQVEELVSATTLTFQDSAGGPFTLAQLAAAGGDVAGPVGATDNALSRFDGATGKVIQNSLGTLADTGELGLVSTSPDTTPLVTFGQSGSNGATTHFSFGSRTPVGNVTGAPGDLYIRISAATSSLYQHQGASSDNTSWTDLTAWLKGTLGGSANVVAVTSGAGGKTLQASPMTVDASTGALALTGTMADTTALAQLGQSGTNGAVIGMFFGSRDPTNNVTGNPGDIYFRDNGTSSAIYQHRGASANNTSWVALATGGGTILGSVGGTANRVPVSSGTGGVTLQAGLITSDPTTGVTSLSGTPADTTPLLTFGQTGTNGATINWTFSTRTPAGNITGTAGDIVFCKNGTSSSIYLHAGAGSDNTSWVDLTGWIRGTLGATADRVPTANGTGGLTLQQSLLSIAQTTGALTLPGTMADTSPLLTLSQSGTNGGAGSITFGTRDPTNNVTAAPGALYVRISTTTSALYQHRGASSNNTGWVAIGAGTGDIVGPISATDNAVTRFDTTTGKLVQNSVVTIDDTGNVNIPTGQTLQLNASVIGGRGFTVISPTALAATTNDYNPTNHQISDIQRIDLTGNQTLTGLTAPSGNTASITKILCNIDATETLTIAHDSASSSAANRILCPNNVNLVIPPRGSVTVLYDSTSTRWRAIEVNNGAIAAPPSILHSVRRSAQLTNITGTAFPGYDTTLATLNLTYWSYSSGSWTCNKAHRAAIFTRMSYQVNSGAVSARAACDIVQGSGGVYTNNLQTHRDSAYSTTDTEGHLTNYAIRDWAVNEQFRVYYYTNAGAMDILAAMNDCTILWVADL